MGNAHGGKKDKSKKGSLSDNLVRDEKRQIKDSYDVVEQALGKGTSTQIKRATSKIYNKTTRSSGGVAIKLYDGNSELPLDLKLEAEILSQCDHPHIVKLYELAKQQKQMSLVMELCTGGSLMDRMPYTEKKASHIMRQVTSAIAYLHNKNIVHRDIELTNILFETKDEDSDIKLIDFGCATQLQLVPGHPGAFKFLKERTGSVHVMAPEVLKGRYGPKADVWSLGVCAYMLLNNGQHPFKGASV
jgi:calcium-dependent protein kinase